MARKQLVRRLPPLRNAPALKAREHKTERLVEILSDLAHTAQEDRPRAFYSMREISAKFRVPTSLVSRVYERLEQEGFLKRIRGSKTVLSGLKYDRKLTVRGFIGLPSATSKFVTVQDYRMFLMSVRRELRLNGFAAATLDIVRREAEEFAERVKKYDIDTIVWFQPGKLAKEAILRLSDLGLRVVGVSDGIRASLPCRYEVHRERATRVIARSWRIDRAIKSVIVISGRAGASFVDQRRVEEILSEEGLSYELLNAKSASIPKFLRSLSAETNVGIVFLSSAAPLFAFRSPEMVTRIFERCRVALIEGPVNMPFADVPNVPVDLVAIDWQKIAKRIVDDLITQEAFNDAKTVTFEAECKLQVPLNQYAQSI